MAFGTAKPAGRPDVAEVMLLYYLLEVAGAWKVRGSGLGRPGCGRQASRCACFHSACAAVVAGSASG